ncbi:MAG: DUF6671 family protein [Putridiphycobacter sp.]|nr:DUF6671 family protein [Putridiphycobacter sp.]
MKTFFEGRTLVIATKHKKESVIAPLLEETLSVKCMVPKNIDTDIFGTFSKEVERPLSPIDTARKKCFLAMEMTGEDLALASEGSFGQHPSIIFQPADDELVMLCDRKNNIEIIGRKLSTDTNFGGAAATNLSESLALAKQFDFNSHALILRANEVDKPLYKGVSSYTDFENKVNSILSKNGSIWIETDMRAMYNPKRMQVIKLATENLLEKISSLCPNCHVPGFWVTDVVPGLPCSACGFPTASTLKYHYSCKHCNHSTYKMNPHGKEYELPQFCNYCNP